MLLTPIRLGVKVTGCEGAHLGKLKYVVVSPGSNRLAYLVVKKGLVDTQDKVVAARLIKTVSTRDGTIQLDLSRSEMDQLGDFVERQYVSTGSYTYDRPGTNDQKIPVDDYAMAYTPSDIILPTTGPYSEKINLPEDSLSFRQGVEVEALDGKVGTLKEVKLNPENGTVESLTIEEGLFFGEVFEIPVELVESADEGSIYLKVTRDEINKSHHGS